VCCLLAVYDLFLRASRNLSRDLTVEQLHLQWLLGSLPALNYSTSINTRFVCFSVADGGDECDGLGMDGFRTSISFVVTE
jgi:hypothetical protein